MKIVIINGSAHKGNTWKLIEQAKQMMMIHNDIPCPHSLYFI